MNDTAFLCSHTAITYFLPVIINLPSSFVDILVGNASSESPRNIFPEDYFLSMSKYILFLKQKNYNVFTMTSERVNQYKFLISDSSFLMSSSFLNQNILCKKNCLRLVHAVDARVKLHRPASFGIFAHQNQAISATRDHLFRDQDCQLFQHLQGFPSEQKRETAYSGPYHLGEWETKRNMPKQQLRKELEEYLHQPIDLQRPVVAFLQDEFCHPLQVQEAIKNLSEHVTVIAKVLSKVIDLPKKAIPWPDAGFAPNLLRFAADYILAGYRSGTLSSSVMLGLRVIPYHTSLMSFGRIIEPFDRRTMEPPDRRTMEPQG